MSAALAVIIAGAAPVAGVYIWFRTARWPLSSAAFLAALVLGPLSLVVSAFAQYCLYLYVRADNVFFGLFIRGAFVEESGRLAVFLAVSAFIRRLESAVPPDVALQRCAARGLVAALSFAALENVWYADGTAAALLRVFTAAPLHAACGARTARAAWIFPHEPLRAAALFFQTVILHGCYNFLVSGSGILPYAAPVLALTAFAAQALALRRAADGDAYSA